MAKSSSSSSSNAKQKNYSNPNVAPSASLHRKPTAALLPAILIGVIAIVSFIVFTNSLPPSPRSSPSRTQPIATVTTADSPKSAACAADLINSRAILHLIRDSLQEYSSHTNPTLDGATLSRLKTKMREYSAFPTGNYDSISPLTPDSFLHELPFELLDAMVSHRSNFIKSHLRSHASDVTESSLRVGNNYNHRFLRPLQLYLEVLKNRAGPPHNKVLSLNHTQSSGIGSAEYNLLEYAVDRNLVWAFHALLPHFQLDQVVKATMQTQKQLNALQLAENNHDEEFIKWLKDQSALKSEAFEPLMQSRLTAEEEQQRAATFSVSEHAHVSDSKHADTTGGWRSSAADVSGKLIAGVEDRGCPFTRVKASELTSEQFEFLLRQKQPVIFTDALSDSSSQTSSSSYSIIDQFRRNTLASTWAHVNASASAIPYGNVFGIKDGAVSFEEFMEYLDTVYEKQIKEGEEEKSATSATSNTKHHQSWISNPPFYIFDSALLEEFGWNPLADIEAGESLQLPPSLQQLPALPTNFFRLPEPIRKAFMKKNSVMQFYLGSEGSGAPFHYHCPALNALVYGKKSWWFYPPSIGYYSKRFPLQSLINPKGLPKPYRCDQYPGELLYVPQHWSHATVNRQESIGVAVEIEANGC